jgi:hypothetical protein
VRYLDAEDLGAGVSVRIEMDETYRAMSGCAGRDVRLGNRMVAAEHDRNQPRIEHLADRSLDRGSRAGGIGG